MTQIDDLIKTYPRVEYAQEAPLVENVILGEHRAVFNRDWSINTQGSHHFLVWDSNNNARSHSQRGLSFAQRCEEVALATKKRGLIELPDDQPYAIGTHFWKGYPFGHWFETLASIRFVPNNDWKIIVNSSDGPVSVRDITQHLDIVGIPPERRYMFEWWKAAPICKRLYCPTIESHLGHLSKSAADWLRLKYLNHPSIKPQLDDVPRKLYLSRNFFTHPNPIWTRKVLNEESEVMPYLESKGFILLKGTEPLVDMIKMFHSATHIVYPHGSMIYYGVFCCKQPKILEFISEHRVRTDFTDLMVSTGITPNENYKMICASNTNPITNDITIDMDVLKKELE